MNSKDKPVWNTFDLDPQKYRQILDLRRGISNIRLGFFKNPNKNNIWWIEICCCDIFQWKKKKNSVQRRRICRRVWSGSLSSSTFYFAALLWATHRVSALKIPHWKLTAHSRRGDNIHHNLLVIAAWAAAHTVTMATDESRWLRRLNRR